VHLREPGQSAKKHSHRTKPARSGFTTVVWHAEHFASVETEVVRGSRKGAVDACVNVYPTARSPGSPEQDSPQSINAQAGIVALTDDGHCVQNHELMPRALEYAPNVRPGGDGSLQDYNLVAKGS